MPFITNCYLAKMSVFRMPVAKSVTYSRDGIDPDMAFCASLRDAVSHCNTKQKFNYSEDFI